MEKNYLKILRSVFFSPKKFFAELPLSGGYKEPLNFYLLLMLLIFVFQMMIGILKLGTTFLALPVFIGSFLGTMIFGMFLLFFNAWILFLFFKIFKAGISYEAILRIMVYSSSVMIFTAIPKIGGFISLAWIIILLIIAFRTITQFSLIKVLGAILTTILLEIMLIMMLVGLIIGGSLKLKNKGIKAGVRPVNQVTAAATTSTAPAADQQQV